MNAAAYILALCSNACFSGASLIFTTLSRRTSPLWMNAFKAGVAWVLFLLTAVVTAGWFSTPPQIILALVVSGILGLAIGDIFLLTAYARMGSARTMILYGFQPVFLGVSAHFLFGQSISWLRLLAVILFLFCLFTFSLEKYRSEGHWEITGLLAALIGVMFDNTGVIISRWSFEQVPEMNAFQANLWRCSGAVAFFLLFGATGRVRLREHWQALSRRDKFWAVFSSMLGTCLSLALYLSAIKIGHLMTISAIGAAGPILSSAMECLYERRRPSRYLLVALGFFIAGFFVLTWL